MQIGRLRVGIPGNGDFGCLADFGTPDFLLSSGSVRMVEMPGQRGRFSREFEKIIRRNVARRAASLLD